MKVLDIACGTGYGIGLLGSEARFVVGVDIDPEAARQARMECGGHSAVLLGNGANLPFADGTFDVVTSFETLEHLSERGLFVAELARVLRPKGKLLLSTPNANYSQPKDGIPSNPFHVFEYTPDELTAELSAHFKIDRLLGQTLDPATGIPPFYDAQKRLPKDPGTQVRLVAWKAVNKIPFRLREGLSGLIWRRPFYPQEIDYNFTEEATGHAPTFMAICTKI